MTEVTGRQPGNLSRTLRTMERYALVSLRREKDQIRPVANATEFQILASV